MLSQAVETRRRMASLAAVPPLRKPESSVSRQEALIDEMTDLLKYERGNYYIELRSFIKNEELTITELISLRKLVVDGKLCKILDEEILLLKIQECLKNLPASDFDSFKTLGNNQKYLYLLLAQAAPQSLSLLEKQLMNFRNVIMTSNNYPQTELENILSNTSSTSINLDHLVNILIEKAQVCDQPEQELFLALVLRLESGANFLRFYHLVIELCTLLETQSYENIGLLFNSTQTTVDNLPDILDCIDFLRFQPNAPLQRQNVLNMLGEHLIRDRELIFKDKVSITA